MGNLCSMMDTHEGPGAGGPEKFFVINENVPYRQHDGYPRASQAKYLVNDNNRPANVLVPNEFRGQGHGATPTTTNTTTSSKEQRVDAPQNEAVSRQPEHVEQEEEITPPGPFAWQKGKLIGAGAFGQVYKGLVHATAQEIAVKQVSLPREGHAKGKASEHIRALEREVAVLKNLRHENIVQYLGTERTEEHLNIFLEYVPGGSIASKLAQFSELREETIQVYTKQILKGLEYLHHRKIMHRDIKGANILTDSHGIIKLADFGASKSIEDLATIGSGCKSIRGTPYWMAPEVIQQTGHSMSADIWSLGCVVIEMATGKPPWSNCRDQVAAMFHIASTRNPPPLPDHLSPPAKDFLLLCFNRVHQERPNATRLLKHPWLVNVQVPVAPTHPTVPRPVIQAAALPAATRSPPSPIPEEPDTSRYGAAGYASGAATARQPRMQTSMAASSRLQLASSVQDYHAVQQQPRPPVVPPLNLAAMKTAPQGAPHIPGSKAMAPLAPPSAPMPPVAPPPQHKPQPQYEPAVAHHHDDYDDVYHPAPASYMTLSGYNPIEEPSWMPQQHHKDVPLQQGGFMKHLASIMEASSSSPISSKPSGGTMASPRSSGNFASPRGRDQGPAPLVNVVLDEDTDQEQDQPHLAVVYEEAILASSRSPLHTSLPAPHKTRHRDLQDMGILLEGTDAASAKAQKWHEELLAELDMGRERLRMQRDSVMGGFKGMVGV